MVNRTIACIATVFFTAFCATAHAQQTVILVRHAEFEGAAMADPKNLPLSGAGEERAQHLAGMLKGSDIEAIYVTDFVRTHKTAEPLARQIGKQFTVLPKGDASEMVQRLRKNHSGQTVLLVGHTDTIPDLLKALGHPAEIKIGPQDYANIFIVTPKENAAPALVRLRY
jgi:broad specificity phosphatase PhoE